MTKILVAIPMYNCARQIGRVLAQFDDETRTLFDEIVVIDNRSKDEGVTRAAEALAVIKGVRTRLLQNRENYGLGGSHKVAFEYALENAFDFVVILHGDDQGSIHDLVPLLRRGEHLDHDGLLGARFAPGARLDGYSTVRIAGNYVFNTLYSIAVGQRLHDLGSGLNLYRTKRLAGREWKLFRNDLTFNYYFTLFMAANGWCIRFFPITWREDDQISNVKMFSQATWVLRIVLSFIAARAAFFAQDHSGKPNQVYTTDTLYQGAG